MARVWRDYGDYPQGLTHHQQRKGVTPMKEMKKIKVRKAGKTRLTSTACLEYSAKL